MKVLGSSIGMHWLSQWHGYYAAYWVDQFFPNRTCFHWFFPRVGGKNDVAWVSGLPGLCHHHHGLMVIHQHGAGVETAICRPGPEM